MYEKLSEIGRLFGISGQLVSFDAPIGGKINGTYRVVYQNNDGVRQYIIQSINTSVFTRPEEMMRNIERVTAHIRARYPQEKTLRFHHTADGRHLVTDSDGVCWRVMDYIEHESGASTDHPEAISAVGAAFGRFQRMLSDFDADALYETIPHFHDTERRLDTLFCHIQEDSCNRVRSVQQEIAYITSVRDTAGALSRQYRRGAFPRRVTHNDTKAANLLFERGTGKPVVIDLDTVMAGMAVYDFGDGIRSLARAADGTVDMEKFRAFSIGYLGETGDFLTQNELDSLVSGVFSVTVELAVRYLDDYLTGDCYFAPHDPVQNLSRFRDLIFFAQDISRRKGELTEIVAECITRQERAILL